MTLRNFVKVNVTTANFWPLIHIRSSKKDQDKETNEAYDIELTMRNCLCKLYAIQFKTYKKN